MSGEYFQWVLPEPSRLDYLPSGDVVASMLAEMASVGWLVSPLPELRIRRPVDGKPESLRLPVSDLAATVEQTIATHGAGFVELPLAEPAEEVDDDVPYDTISAERCYAGKLLIAANLSAVHSDGWQEGFLACPECSADVAAVVVPEASPSLWRSFWSAASVSSAPASCPACSRSLELEGIWHHAKYKGAVREPKDQAPFFRVALELADGRPSSDPALLDQALAAALQRATGIPFRSVGRWV